jgi:hypothetical protein
MRGKTFYDMRLQHFKAVKISVLLLRMLTYSREQILPEKLTAPQINKKFFPHFMEPEGSLPHSKTPANCPYPEA